MISIFPLTPSQVPQRYHLRTTTAIQVGRQQFENELLSVVEQRVLSRNSAGYQLEICVLHSTQKAEDLMSRVVADVNQASRRLVVQIDTHGNLLRVENQPEVWQAWQQLRQPLRDKYAATPDVLPFLQVFEQQLAVPGSLEANLRYKGLMGALLPGLYGYDFGPGQPPVETTRLIAGFFHDLDLPLVLRSEGGLPHAESSPAVPAVYVTTTGVLDTEHFATEAFRRLIRDLVDDFKFAVNLEITCTASHAFEPVAGHLLHSRQELRAEVPGIYYNATTHELVAQPANA